jgi:hypothetical protein
MGIGPVESRRRIPGNQFNGDVAPALQDLIGPSTIRVLVPRS